MPDSTIDLARHPEHQQTPSIHYTSDYNGPHWGCIVVGISRLTDLALLLSKLGQQLSYFASRFNLAASGSSKQKQQQQQQKRPPLRLAELVLWRCLYPK